MIAVDNLTKIYSSKTNSKTYIKSKKGTSIHKAVDSISFNVTPNEIFGLLGPNGAGKTTTLRCISTLLKPTSGNIYINEYDTVKDSKKVRELLCFLTNEIKLDDHFTPNYIIEFFGKLYSMNDEDIYNRKKILFSKLGIDSFANVKISELSTGMKQKTSIAVSLVHDPEVIIFDEPTNGLDIITAKTVTDYLLSLKKEGKTIIISTHIMSVAAKLCDRIAILIDGKIKLLGTNSQILEKTNSTDLEEAFFKLYEQK